MPRRLVKAPSHDRDRSLGYLAEAWMAHFCVHGPGDVQGEKVEHGDEIYGFIVDCYALEPTGRLLYDSAFLSRPKGADKSGLGARFCLFEALGPCRFAGFAKGGEVYVDPWGLGFRYVYQPGEPMGRRVRIPYIRVLATEEHQTGHVYKAIYVNLTEGPLQGVPGLDAGLTRTFLPGGGEITPSTAGSASKDGGKETFAVFDESHLYNLPELRRMYDTVTRNMRKRKRHAGTWYLETTTMFAAGEDSIAEATYRLAGLIEQRQSGQSFKNLRSRALFDHRWGECENLSDEEALREAIEDAFGEAIAWNDLDALVDEFYDPRKDPVDSRRYFLNAPSSSADAWLREPEWAARRARDADGIPLLVEVGPRELVVMGFDGSRKRSRGVTDATALIGVRVRDGHVFQIRVWEQPPGTEDDWEVPRSEVNAAVDAAFLRYTVVGFFADPAKWETDVAVWEATYGPRLRVKSNTKHPIAWWMVGGRARAAIAATTAFHDAITGAEMTHDGALELTAHVLNARRRLTGGGVQIAKENPDSPRKIDAAVAAILAWQARLAAVSGGVKDDDRYTPTRITKRRRGGPSADRR